RGRGKGGVDGRAATGIAGMRGGGPGLKRDGQFFFLGGPSRPAVVAAIEAAIGRNEQGRGLVIGGDATNDRRRFGQRASQRAPGRAEVVADIDASGLCRPQAAFYPWFRPHPINKPFPPAPTPP